MIYCGIISALFSLFLVKCFEPNMIFRRYYLLLNYVWIRNWRKKDRWKRFILKPFGLCVYCFGAWLTIFVSLFIFKFTLVDSILSIGVSNIILMSWEKLLS
jgi:hypothetical protein